MSKKLKSVDLKDALATAEAELASVLKRADTLRQWIALTRRVGASQSKSADTFEVNGFIRSRRTKAVGVIKNVLEVLNEAGQPMHVDDIVEKLRDRGQLPAAKNPKATIAVALSRRTDQFRKTGPNTFGLASAPQDAVVTMAS
jgi:hypothetical protein